MGSTTTTRRIRILRVDYQVVGGELVVRLYGRRDDGTRARLTLTGTEPRFYTRDNPTHPSVVRVDTDSVYSLDGEPLNTVVVKYPFQVPQVRDECDETWEADVVYPLRVRFDLGIKSCIEDPGKATITPDEVKPAAHSPTIEPRKVEVDIETLGFSDPEAPTLPVTCLTAYDSYSDSYLCIFNAAKRNLTEAERAQVMSEWREKNWKVQMLEAANERQLFAYFKQFLATVEPDILIGHNGDHFDWPYLRNRAKLEGYPAPNWDEYCYADTMLMYIRQHEGDLVSAGLDYISKSLGLEGKSTHEGAWRLYESKPAELITYNVNDVYLMKEVEQRKGLVRFFYDLAAFVGMEPNLLWNGKRFATTRVVESFLFHKLRGRAVQPTKRENQKVDFEGALALPPKGGFHFKVIELDNSGEYANIMRTFNMSPETFVGKGCACKGATCYVLPSGNHYKKSPRGIIPESLDELLALREELKKAGDKEQERVVKEVILSYWGTAGNEHFRHYVPDMAADIAWMAREHLDYNRKWLEGKGLEVIGGFTDAAFAKFPSLNLSIDELRKVANQLAVDLNATYGDWSSQWGTEGKHTLAVKLENVYDAMFLAASEGASRGNYICLYRSPKGPIERDTIRYDTKVRGFQSRKSSAAALTKRLQNEVFVMALLGDDAKTIKTHLRGVITDLKSGKIPPEECGLPLRWTKEAYSTKPSHVKAAEWSNKHLGTTFGPGSKPCQYFVTSVPGKPATDSIALEWWQKLPPGTQLNWGHTIERVVMMPLASLFAEMRIRPTDILEPTADAEDFF